MVVNGCCIQHTRSNTLNRAERRSTVKIGYYFLPLLLFFLAVQSTASSAGFVQFSSFGFHLRTKRMSVTTNDYPTCFAVSHDQQQKQEQPEDQPPQPVVATTTSTTTTRADQVQTVLGRGGTMSSLESLHECSSCQQLYPRSSFQKKTFRQGIQICNDCRKAQYASSIKPKSKLIPIPSNNQSGGNSTSSSTNKTSKHQKTNHPTPIPTTAATTTNTLHGRRAASGMYRRPNNFGYCNYVDQLFGMKCFGDIATLGVVQSAKDVSESMAALQGVIRHGMIPDGEDNYNRTSNARNNPAAKSISTRRRDVVCLCIGDGTTPRTAVLAAFTQPQWLCVSIDPALQETWCHNSDINTNHSKNENVQEDNKTAPKKVSSVRGLIGYRGTLEEFMVSLSGENDRTAKDDTNNNNNNLWSAIIEEDDSWLLRSTSDAGIQHDPPTTTTMPPLRQEHTDGNSSGRRSPPPPLPHHLVLMCVHSHARLIEPHCSVSNIRSHFGYPPTTLVSLPCCATFRHTRDIGREPDIRYDDDCVFSAQRTVEIWKYERGEE